MNEQIITLDKGGMGYNDCACLLQLLLGNFQEKNKP